MAAFSEDLGSILSIHMVAQPAITTVPGLLPFGLCGYQAHDPQTYMGRTAIYIFKKS